MLVFQNKLSWKFILGMPFTALSVPPKLPLEIKEYEVIAFHFIFWVYDFGVQILIGSDSFTILDALGT